MNIAIDLGNTSAKIGVFQDEVLIRRIDLRRWTVEELSEYLTNQTSENVILSNVTAFSIGKLTTGLQQLGNFLLLDENTKLPINNLYKTPKTLGKDRLAAVVGGFVHFPGEPILVIDAGTCITYDWLTSDGDYLGGNIAPGLYMRFKAMHEFTGNLPMLKPNLLEAAIGYDTKSAMQIGGIQGLLHEIEGFIRQGENRFKGLKIMLTGGDAEFLAKKLKKQIFVDQNLVLVGLNKILDYNASQKL